MAQPRYGIVERIFNQSYGLPKGKPYKFETHDVIARDGTVLKVALFRPTGQARGTLAAMTPYGRTGMAARGAYGVYASQGFNVLVVSVRGTFDSGTEFNPMLTDGSDFRDAITWMKQQDWYTGSFATFGASYLGWAQWNLLAEHDPDHKAAIIAVGPHDFQDFHWGAGGTLGSSLLMWGSLLEAQEDQPLRTMLYAATKGEAVYKSMKHAPVSEAAYALFPSHQEWIHERLSHAPSDEYWAQFNLSDVLSRTTIPVLISTGWQDVFLEQSLTQFQTLHARGIDVSLTVGPWEHGGASISAKHLQESLEWLREHLEGGPRERRLPVHVNVTGADEWHEMADWPPAVTPLRFGLTTESLREVGGSASAAGSDRVQGPGTAGIEGTVVIPFDPNDQPVFAGGPLLLGGGYKNDSAAAKRTDVFAIDSAPLTADLEVHGTMLVGLDHSAACPDSNVFVRVSEVDHRGRSTNVAQGAMHVEADGQIEIRLSQVAHRFIAGNRIRLAIAGGAYPHFPASPGTGEHPLHAKERVRNTHTIGLANSYLELPVLST